MAERVLLLTAVAVVVAIGMHSARALSRRQTERRQSGSPSALWQALGERPDGRPTIVAFSTRSCAVCRTAQAPALEEVERTLGPGSIRIIAIDAAARPDLVKAFGIMTAPTTVVFVAEGQLRAYNRGFATTDRLLGQLSD